MKKLFLTVVAAALFTTAAQAQIVSSRSTRITTQHTPSNILWYTRVGIAIDGISGDVEGNSSKIGYDWTIGFQKSIQNAGGIYWGMDLGLMTRGYKRDTGNTEVWTAHAIQLSPIAIGWKYDLSNNIAIDLHVGAYASYDLFGSLKYDDSDYDPDNDWDDDLQKFDAGINAGVGVWINKRINVNLSYRQGMVNMSDKDYGNNPSFYAHKIVLSLGYAF